MTDVHTQFIEPAELKIGMFVYLDVGWMDHPFPVSNFRITTQQQIDTIRSLGLERVRYAPSKSLQVAPAPATPPAGAATPDAAAESEEARALRLRRALLAEQQASLQACERQFSQAAQTFRAVAEQVHAQPDAARAQVEQLITGFLGEVLGEDEAAIRLLSEKAGEKASLHSINVTVLSLLLGKALGLDKKSMFELGTGALLHDIGKIALPDRLRWIDEQFTHAERQLYQSHVMHGVALAKKMTLPQEALLLIGQHHEQMDGQGYPAHTPGEKIVTLARVVGLVNHYDNLCNPANPALAITPHEALSLLFTQFKSRYYAPTLTAFIRMMGIYPPGSVVQLTDERYAMVVSVNAARPIRPRIVIHEPRIPADEALIINLEQEPQLCIHRSLKPLQLPKAAFDYLSPRKRLCYFFERSRELEGMGGALL